MPLISFVKMHSLGNDFVIINFLNDAHPIDSRLVRSLSNRFMGIGFDQLLILERSNQADIFCRIFNADGSEAAQCGNGLRCVARYMQEEMQYSSELCIETKAGVCPVHILDFNHIQVGMGTPLIREKLVEIGSKDIAISISILDLGNPHAIFKNESSLNMPHEEIAHLIAKQFPQGINVGLMNIRHPASIELRTFERGVGETHACGSNACAAVASGIINGWLKSPVNVHYRYGELMVAWPHPDQSIQLVGPATRVFEGSMRSNDQE